MIQQKINQIWGRALKLEDISDDDDFFALGGHSLIMATVQTAIHDEIGIEIPMDELFRHPTVRSISAYAESRLAVS
ncbi:phosphopantetheine-binding protein [Streptomyces sp. ASQP_92]|uniref:Surfactin synthase subunit 3 n=1 Tax=Streptomyces hundungensis TaxID=1077946 RepID=A0A387H5M7_9ACTN|nr:MULTISPECIES: phosphopantetheine-binding protein [Streptomyces]AYG79085.1 Surfactin synthase subunit 3 [Streptomyces hundungensis]MCT9093783.1 phosphopantetheine-binding protein [Streptomyces sp. ASQP_92]